MATGQIPNNDPEKGVKEEQNVSQEDIKTIVKFLKRNTLYKILTEEKYANLTHSLVDQDDQGIPRIASSTPKPYKMAPNVPRIGHPLMFYNPTPTILFLSLIPKSQYLQERKNLNFLLKSGNLK